MKKTVIAITLILALVLSLSACGKSEAAAAADKLIASIGDVTIDSGAAIAEAEKAVAALEDADAAELDNMDLLKSSRAKYNELILTNEEWYGIYDGDKYSFTADGTGSHDDISLKYSISDNSIEITEGAAGTENKTLTIDASDETVKLVEAGTEVYYVNKAAYDEIGEKIRNEYTKELLSHEAWALHNNGAFGMYYMFSEGGSGFAVLKGATLGLRWEFVDNNTLKLTIKTNIEQSANYDIVVEDGSYKLLQTNNSAIVVTPHN